MIVCGSNSPIKHLAVLAQVAAAIAIAEIMQARRENHTDIDLGEHQIMRGKRLYLVIEPDDVKHAEPIDFRSIFSSGCRTSSPATIQG